MSHYSRYQVGIPEQIDTAHVKYTYNTILKRLAMFPKKTYPTFAYHAIGELRMDPFKLSYPHSGNDGIDVISSSSFTLPYITF